MGTSFAQDHSLVQDLTQIWNSLHEYESPAQLGGVLAMQKVQYCEYSKKSFVKKMFWRIEELQ